MSLICYILPDYKYYIIIQCSKDENIIINVVYTY